MSSQPTLRNENSNVRGDGNRSVIERNRSLSKNHKYENSKSQQRLSKLETPNTITEVSDMNDTDPILAKKKFQIDDFKTIKHLGKGSFGIVKLVQHTKTKQNYAMKCLNKENIRGKKQIQHIMNERDILKKFKPQDFCCNIYESLQDEMNLYMILDFLPGGELFKLIRNNVLMAEKQARFYIGEIVLAIDSLHQMGIIYRDLKPENILLDKDGHIKLIDFGFAKNIQNIHQNRAYTNCGTPGYCAPEVMLDAGHTYKADIWSIGILLCEIIGGFTPF